MREGGWGVSPAAEKFLDEAQISQALDEIWNPRHLERLARIVFGPSLSLEIDEELRVVPHLASRLENPDPLTYIVQLRSGVVASGAGPRTSATDSARRTGATKQYPRPT